jgi:hypothetical protein
MNYTADYIAWNKNGSVMNESKTSGFNMHAEVKVSLPC